MAAPRMWCFSICSRILRNLLKNPNIMNQRNLLNHGRGILIQNQSGNFLQVKNYRSTTTGDQDLITKLNTQNKTPDTEDSTLSNAENEPSVNPDDKFMVEQVKSYEAGKRWLASIMGEDPAKFTDQDIVDALKYLMPSSLYAKDARPTMKHPTLLFPPRKEDLFDKDGRPFQPGFYTGQVALNDLLYEIFQQVDKIKKGIQTQEETRVKQLGMSDQKLSDVAQNQTSDKSDIVWVSREQLQKTLDEPIDEREHRMVISRLTELSQMDNSYLIEDFLKRFYGKQNFEGTNYKADMLDENGYAHAFGYRKSAVAEVWLKRGTGTVTVNDQPFIEYFHKIQDRQQIAYPFLVVDEIGKFDVICNVMSGGFTGQSGAIRVAIARALLSFSEEYRPKLEKAHLLEVDIRKVERKKPGQKKARKKFAWVAR